ncbi:MAG TPA: DUF2934 domain-containing protein [Terriglobia bacterium]|nr:DUF2934 domain-containing protein [Terriglobia bacterium]
MAKVKRGSVETADSSSSVPISEAEIQLRAYERYLARGCEDGHDLEDWLEAERALQKERRAA